MKKLVSLLMVLIMITLSACGGSTNPSLSQTGTQSEEQTSGYEYPTMKITVAHDISEAHPTHAGIVKWSELVSEATDGKITLEIYPNAVLGSRVCPKFCVNSVERCKIEQNF